MLHEYTSCALEGETPPPGYQPLGNTRGQYKEWLTLPQVVAIYNFYQSCAKNGGNEDNSYGVIHLTRKEGNRLRYRLGVDAMRRCIEQLGKPTCANRVLGQPTEWVGTR